MPVLFSKVHRTIGKESKPVNRVPWKWGKRKEGLEKLSLQSQESRLCMQNRVVPRYTHHLPTLFPVQSLRPEISTCFESGAEEERTKGRKGKKERNTDVAPAGCLTCWCQTFMTTDFVFFCSSSTPLCFSLTKLEQYSLLETKWLLYLVYSGYSKLRKQRKNGSKDRKKDHSQRLAFIYGTF